MAEHKTLRTLVWQETLQQKRGQNGPEIRADLRDRRKQRREKEGEGKTVQFQPSLDVLIAAGQTRPLSPQILLTEASRACVQVCV